MDTVEKEWKPQQTEDDEPRIGSERDHMHGDGENNNEGE